MSSSEAKDLGREDQSRLTQDRKLVLLVDLDQTLIHTTNDSIPPNLKDVYHFQLYGQNSPWYHTRVRPGTASFLQRVSALYELHICTFGARLYAHTIAAYLDPDKKFFRLKFLSVPLINQSDLPATEFCLVMSVLITDLKLPTCQPCFPVEIAWYSRPFFVVNSLSNHPLGLHNR